MNNKKIISVSGYGSTGSSAVVDYLKEFNSCYIMGGEFRMIQDPDGLEELCNSLKNSWGWVRSDAYIRRFIKYTNIIGRKISLIQYGEHLNKAFNYNFFKHRDNFINNIVDTKWDGHWFYHDYHERSFRQTIIENIKRSLSWHFGLSREWLRKNTLKSNMYFVRSDIDIFTEAQLFLTNLFSEIDTKEKNLIFDQLILPYHKEKYDLLFPNLKQIVVNRDPRDVYLDARNYNAYPITKNINSFISFYEASMISKEILSDKYNLSIKFEDLIYNYEYTTEVINCFLELSSNSHTQKYMYFSPNRSILNTKTWLNLNNKKLLNDIKTIELKLEKWCYHF